MLDVVREVCAVLVLRGDLVRIRGCWHEVRGSRLDRFVTGGAVVVLTLADRRPVRMPVFLRVTVIRDPAPRAPVATHLPDGDPVARYAVESP
ncbi:hypothetical protein OG204_14605 [Streptomyces sp. NBC_01387]|uniref:hypothetical protein n=1 Tax=Streptomyces sp. NBC_01387 TaxID=2903849 RepID=UPI003248F1E3